MKKFLSVLLALAVAFTFTFGSTMSAFATAYYDTQKAYETALDKAAGEALADLDSYYEMAQGKVKINGKKSAVVTSYAITAENWTEVLKTVYADAKKDIDSQLTAKKTSAAYDAKEDAVTKADFSVMDNDDLTAALYNEVNSEDEADKTASKYAIAAAKLQFAADKVAALDNAKSIDVELYSKTKAESTVGSIGTVDYDNSYDYAVALKAALIEKIDAVVLATTDDTVSEVAAAAGTIADFFTTTAGAGTQKVLVKTEADGTKTYLLADNKLKTKASETGDAITLDAAKDAAKASMNNKVAAAYSGLSNKDNAEVVAAWTEVKNAYIAIYTYVIDNATNVTALNKAMDDMPEAGITKNPETGKYEVTNATAKALINNVNVMKNAETLLAAMKTMTNVDGSLKYDAEKLDKNMKTVYANVYGKVVADTVTINTSKADAVTEANIATADVNAALSAVSAYEKAEAKADIANLIETAETSTSGYNEFDGDAYYDLEWSKVTEAINAYNAAVDAATTVAAMSKAGTDLSTAISKIKTADEVFEYYYKATTGTLYTTAKAQADVIGEYISYINNSTVADADKRNCTEYDSYAEIAEMLAAKGARTNDEVKAATAGIKAEIDALPTAGALKTEREAVLAEIDALPAQLNVTLADKDAIAKAAAALKAYEDKTGSTSLSSGEKTKLTNAISKVKTLEETAIDDAFKALPVAANLAVTDKDAVKAIAAQIDAYEATEMYAGATYSTYDIAVYAKQIRSLELDAVKKAIAALPETVTAKDQAAVEAAKKAYDAFVAEYTTYDTNNVCSDKYDAEANVTTALVTKLTVSVATVDAAVKAVEDAKAALKADLKIAKVTTKNVATKKIKVTGYKNTKAEYYQVQYKKSTASTYKYATKKTTSTSKTIKVTKKGTYKVRVRACVKMDDGTIVKGAWKTVTRKVTK